MNLAEIPERITVICLGNICRSPVGEYLLRYYAQKSDLPHIREIQFDSAGLSGGYGGMDFHSEKYLKRYNMSYRKFRSKRTSTDYLNQYDMILVMEDYMVTDILEEYFYEDQYIGTLLTFSEAAGSHGDIEDPYGMPWNYYLKIMEIINNYSKKIIQIFEEF